MKEVMIGDEYVIEAGDELAEIDSTQGETSNEDIEGSVLKSVLQNEQKTYDKGQIIGEAFNQGISSFSPDIMFENIVNNYSMAKKVYGETLIRLISGYSDDYLKRNIRIPEFKRELKKKIEGNIEEMKEAGLLKKDMTVSENGLKLASMVIYAQELDSMISKGIFGEKINKKKSHYGDRGDSRNYRKGDRYKDISIKESIKLAVKRGHNKLDIMDIKIAERQSKGQVNIIYGIDASGSMKGKKLEMCKKAGVALAFKAINAKDKVGLIVFGDEVKEEIAPTDDFMMLLQEITKVKASKQTNFKEMIRKSLELFPAGDYTKHLIILTDAMPTVGENPEKESLDEIAKIKNAGITVSIVGINLGDESKDFAEKAVQIGEGRLYVVTETEELDRIVLQDYYSVV